MRFATDHLFRPKSFTLLVVFSHRLVRADFAGDTPKVERLWHAEAPIGEALPVLADAAFSLGPHRKTQVLLLAGTFWTGVLSLSAPKAATLSSTELTQALGFEAEALSNISPFDSSLATVPLMASNGDRVYWVTQASSAEVGAVEDTLLRHGARLISFAHLAGLPRPLSAESDGPWERIELWGDYAVCLQRNQDPTLRLQVIGTSSMHGGWLKDAANWFGPQSNPALREFIVAPHVAVSGAADATHDLSDERVLTEWLTAWAKELGTEPPHVPLLRPIARPLSIKQLAALAFAFAVVIILLCSSHWLWLQRRERAFQRELVRAQAPSKRLEDLKARAANAEQKLTVARRELEAVLQLCGDWEAVTGQERRRHLVLLRAVAEMASDDFVLQSITESAGEIHVLAIATRPELPNFSSHLAEALKPIDWSVEAPRRKALNLSADGGPWQLEWALRQAAPTNSAFISASTSPPGPSTHPVISLWHPTANQQRPPP